MTCHVHVSFLLSLFLLSGIANGWQEQADGDIAVSVDTGNEFSYVRQADVGTSDTGIGFSFYVSDCDVPGGGAEGLIKLTDGVTGAAIDSRLWKTVVFR